MRVRDILRRWRERKPLYAASTHDAVSGDETRTAEELHQRGALLLKGKHYAAAVDSLARSLQLKHDLAPAHLDLAMAYLGEGQVEDAADSLRLAVHFAPQLTSAWYELGRVLVKLARFDEAETAYRSILKLDPSDGAAWLGLGDLYKARSDLTLAVECYGNAVNLAPGLAEAHCQRGFALYKLGRYDESHACFDAALAVRPEYTEALHNLGLVQLETAHPDEALESFTRALATHPGIAETRACIGHALRDLGRLDEAVQCYDDVLAERPQFMDALINRSYAYLMREDYDRGWAGYENRFGPDAMQGRGFPFKPWDGKPLDKKRILVYAEQGLGDEIMFASCLPDLLTIGASCVIECNTRVAPLFARSFPQAHVQGASKQDDQAWLAELPPVDCQTAIGSLPLRFRRTPAAFPAPNAYLKADPLRISHWRRLLAETSTDRHVGIAWRGGSLRTRQQLRTIPLLDWIPVLEQPGVQFHILQYGETASEIEALPEPFSMILNSVVSITDDLDELAALITALDLVISVDNTVAHLAGALGKPTWIMLSFSPEWRYPRVTESMRWYPSARLFKQHEPRAWAPVIGRVAAALAIEVDRPNDV